MAILPKTVNIFNASYIKISISFLIEIEESLLKFMQKQKRPPRAKAILSKKINAGGITTPDFNVYYRLLGRESLEGSLFKTSPCKKSSRDSISTNWAW
jgi:hypothetical protein